MEISYRFVVWDAKEPIQHGLVIDPRQAKLLADVAKAGSRFDQLVTRPRVQVFLGWVAERFGHPPVGGQGPPPPSAREDDLQDDVRDQHDDATQAEHPLKVPALLEQGLCFRGNCPSCGHSMSWAIPFGVLVDQNELVKMVREDGLASATGAFVNRWPWKLPQSGPVPYAGSRPDNPTIAPSSCGAPARYDHPGRPTDAVFVGCSAAWNQRMTGNEKKPWGDKGMPWSLSPATPGEAEWAAHIKELASPPLARIRATANEWRNGVTGLTAVLTAVALLSGSATASQKWHPWNKGVTLALAVVGFTLLLMGTFTVLSASIGVGGYDHRMLATHALRRYERNRGRDALGQIRKTQVLVIAGVAFIAASGFFAFANPNRLLS